MKYKSCRSRLREGFNRFLSSSLSTQPDQESLGGKRSNNEPDWLTSPLEDTCLSARPAGFRAAHWFLYIAPVLVELVDEPDAAN